jgi:hypothetical protein
MSEHLAWARWWACPWAGAQSKWGVLGSRTNSTALYRSRHTSVSTALAIEPCLPPIPSSALLRLVFASAQQRELMLTLIDSILRPINEPSLNEDQYLWCLRLAKAVPPDPLLLSAEDPLQYLRAWVEPAVWQRLRVAFTHKRVLDLERHPMLADNHGRLNTLWQAAIWRATSITSDDARPQSGENDYHVVPTKN